MQVDFCAFRELVDAVGGVDVPFEFPARDRKSGLVVAETGCISLEGDMALAYVRSRSYEFEDPPGSGEWTTDGTSDFGRIGRQQDFLRRVVAKVINDGLYSPNVASALITTNQKYLVTDTGLTVNRMLEFANTLRRLDKNVVMLQYVGENHGLRDPANRKDYTVRMREFFDHYLRDLGMPGWLQQGVDYLDLEDHLQQRAQAIADEVKAAREAAKAAEEEEAEAEEEAEQSSDG